MANVTSVTNHFLTAQEGFTTTTSGSVASGATTVGLNSVTGYSNGDNVAFVIDPTDTNKKQVFTGVIDTSGVQVTGVKWTEGTNQTHAAGATVVDYTTATHQAALVKGLEVSLDQDGTLKAGAVDNAAALASDVVTTAKIADDAVTPAKRTGGFYIGTIAVTSTGTVTVSDIGFEPKLLKIYGVVTDNDVLASSAIAVYDGTSGYCMATVSSGSAGFSRFYSNFAMINAAPSQIVNVNTVAFTSSGFTFNVAIASSSVTVWYEAYS